VPLEIRELNNASRATKVDKMGVYLTVCNGDMTKMQFILDKAIAIESGRYVVMIQTTCQHTLCSYIYRDIGGSDPERMAPPGVADYIVKVCHNTTTITTKYICRHFTTAST
jgi:hypothetical protein